MNHFNFPRGTLFYMCFLLSGCDRGPSLASQYGTNYNARRVALGMHELPGNWKLDSSENADTLTWHRPLNDRPKSYPLFASKYTTFRNGKLVMESDIYRNGNIVTNFEGGKMEEEASVTYYFEGNHLHNSNEIGVFILAGPDRGEYSGENGMLILERWRKRFEELK